MLNAILHILVILGAIGLFLFGMRTLSESIQKLAGRNLRKMLRGITSSPLRATVAGTVITALIQSSSATTTLIVSLANASLLNLRRAMAMTMGANIGTTLTAWLVVLFGFEWEISTLAVPLIGIGFPLTLLQRRNQLKFIGSTLMGFALLLLAISILKTDLAPLSQQQGLIDLISHISDFGIWAPLLYVCIGALMTALFQSSSVTTTLTIVLCGSGLIPFEGALALILGENLGTTATANVAASITNTTARRAALSHTLFNLIGILWALPLLSPITSAIDQLTLLLGVGSPISSAAAQPIALALFHTLFNTLNTLLLVGFIPQMERLLIWVLRDRSCAQQINTSTHHPQSGILSTSELLLYQAQQELIRYAKASQSVFGWISKYFREVSTESLQNNLEQLERGEAEARALRKNFNSLLDIMVQQEISPKTQKRVQHLFLISSELRSVLRYEENLIDILRRKKERNIWFSPLMRTHTLTLFQLVEQTQELTLKALDTPPAQEQVDRLQVQIKEQFEQIHEESLQSQNDQEMTFESRMIFTQLSAQLYQLIETQLYATTILIRASKYGHPSKR